MVGWKPENTATVVAAIIVGGAILAGSWLVRSSLDEAANQIEGIGTRLTETKDALKLVAEAQPPPAEQPRPRGPDPNRRYEIKVAGSPAKGPASAQVVIAEFSDFQ
jgi:hypothetical protein